MATLAALRQACVFLITAGTCLSVGWVWTYTRGLPAVTAGMAALGLVVVPYLGIVIVTALVLRCLCSCQEQRGFWRSQLWPAAGACLLLWPLPIGWPFLVQLVAGIALPSLESIRPVYYFLLGGVPSMFFCLGIGCSRNVLAGALHNENPERMRGVLVTDTNGEKIGIARSCRVVGSAIRIGTGVGAGSVSTPASWRGVRDGRGGCRSGWRRWRPEAAHSRSAIVPLGTLPYSP
jgi:hypothetical protein